MENLWHVARDGKTSGPYTVTQLRTLAANGDLGRTDLVWREGIGDWTPAGQVRGLFPPLATPPPPPPPSETLDAARHAHSPRAVATMAVVGDGKLAWSGDYGEAYQIVHNGLQECSVVVKEQEPAKGVLRGKCKYGLNPFGITVTATFYDASPQTMIEIAATLTDAIDTFGACGKKVRQITSRIYELGKGHDQPSSSGALQVGGNNSVGQPSSIAVSSGARPPQYSQRAGASYRGKALTGFWLSIAGVFIGPAAVVGLIMCSLALNGMSTSTNEDGRGFAIAGAVIGMLAIVGWILVIMS